MRRLMLTTAMLAITPSIAQAQMFPLDMFVRGILGAIVPQQRRLVVIPSPPPSQFQRYPGAPYSQGPYPPYAYPQAPYPQAPQPQPEALPQAERGPGRVDDNARIAFSREQGRKLREQMQREPQQENKAP
jgi:hypothetical protein